MTDTNQIQALDAGNLARRAAVVALVLNGFAIIAVNYWIYYARSLFIERHWDTYQKPPTISRAISDPFIGEPFSVWVTISSLCLVVGVGLLALRYIRQINRLPAPSTFLRVAALVIYPVLVALQIASALGMYWLSAYRFPDANEMHMVGSYTFFISQALVILLFAVASHALLRDRDSLAHLHEGCDLHESAVKLRCGLGYLAIAMTFCYFALFKAKDAYSYDAWPVLYWAYTLMEPAVISAFLLVLAMCHIDLFRKRPI